MEELKRQMADFYDSIGFTWEVLSRDPQQRKEKIAPVRKKIYEEMDAFYRENPGLSADRFKSRVHTAIAKHFEPKLFPDCPFFFEMGLRERNSWGLGRIVPSYWTEDRLGKAVRRAHPLLPYLEQQFAPIFQRDPKKDGIGLCSIPRSFDSDHHTLGYTLLFAKGIDGILADIRQRRAECTSSEQTDFYLAAEESCLALLQVAEKFSRLAQQLLPQAETPRQRQFLEMIRTTAKKIPAQPPQTFYEGLAMLLFTRETVATLENMGISQLGHLDRLLGPLYEADLAQGRITPEEAEDLLGRWFLYTDIKFDLTHNSWPETSTCVQLGGCDAAGKPIFNAVTRMVIRVHHRLGLVNPKLNCRYGPDTPEEYLQLIGEAILAGHNNFVLINDAVVTQGLVGNGVRPEDARLYVSGGCQETMLEGMGHTEGAALYVSLPRILDLFLRPGNTDVICPVGQAETFEEFYSRFFSTVEKFLALMLDNRNVCQQYNQSWQGCPLFSVTQAGCLETGRDYVRGGARYNFSTVALVGLGTVVDSLYAIRELVYRQKCVSLEALNRILASNWQSDPELRKKAIDLPKYGHGEEAPDALAAEFLQAVAAFIRSRTNQRGGAYIPSLFVYYYFEYFAPCLRATPDGRLDGDLISPGCGPGQLRRCQSITQPLNTMGNMDFTVCGGGSAVLDVKLPRSGRMDGKLFAALCRSCEKLGCPTLQPNSLRQEDLLDAKAHPEKHPDLIVRVSGLSAYFVALSPKIQEEIIQRELYER